MSKYLIYWFDDAPKRVEPTKAVLEGTTNFGEGVEVSVFAVGEQAINQVGEFARELETRPPHLVVIDHIFNNSGVLRSGSALAHLLRSLHPNVPFVCVSAAVGDRGTFDQEELSEYTHIFPFAKIADDDQLELLVAIARDFGTCVSAADKPEADLFLNDLLRCPQADRESLWRVLPAEFKNVDRKPTPHRIARWLLSTFLARPGYVYDELRVATLLGLTVEGFRKVASNFEAAVYKGAFSTSARPKWWVSTVQELLFALVPQATSPSTAHTGRMLPGVSEDDHSKCWIDDASQPAPEVVAYTDSAGIEEVAVRSKYTALYPPDAGVIPGFEPRLMLTRSA
jgi:hypothetical protein